LRAFDPTAVHETKSPRPIDADSAAALVMVKATESAMATELVVKLVADLAKKQKAGSRRQKAGGE
jgi:hypothetical protein